MSADLGRRFEGVWSGPAWASQQAAPWKVGIPKKERNGKVGIPKRERYFMHQRLLIFNGTSRGSEPQKGPPLKKYKGFKLSFSESPNVPTALLFRSLGLRTLGHNKNRCHSWKLPRTLAKSGPTAPHAAPKAQPANLLDALCKKALRLQGFWG